MSGRSMPRAGSIMRCFTPARRNFSICSSVRIRNECLKNGERNQATSNFATCMPIRSASMVIDRYAITYQEQRGNCAARAGNLPSPVSLAACAEALSVETAAGATRAG